VTELITIMVFANHASAIGLLLFGAWQRAAVDGLFGHALERAPLRGSRADSTGAAPATKA